MERLASEETCMMRVFVKWHAEVEVGGRKRLIELTDEDAEASLSSMGISHLSEVHLDGPLTGDSDGVGQALAVLGAQMRQMDKGQSRIATLLETIAAQNAAQQSSNAAIIHQLQANNGLALLPSEAYLARQSLVAEEGLAYSQLMAMDRHEGYCCLLAESTVANKKLAEASAEIKKLSIEARNRPSPFTIDRTTPHKAYTISGDGTTATKIYHSWTNLRAILSDRFSTFRASQPLTATNHKWAVKIVEDVGKPDQHHDIGLPRGFILIGLLPKLSDAQVAEMEGWYIGSTELGGWGMWGDGAMQGNWQCPSFTFGKGDVVVCDFNFAAKTLTLSCGGRKAVGTIPSIKEGDELYPAVSMYYEGQQVVFVAECFLCGR